ncbi:MAG: diguanylate cyclase domain-containing protein [Marinibacterium sp.]
MEERLLLIDAVATNRIAMHALLDPAGYALDEQTTIADAMAAISENRPLLILTAWSLPDGTAADLRQALDALDPDHEIPVIALAHPSQAARPCAALLAGLADMLYLPVDAELLQAKVRSVLRLHDRIVELGLPPAAAPGTQMQETELSGLAEAPAPFVRRRQVLVFSNDGDIATDWAKKLDPCLKNPVCGHDLGQYPGILSAGAPPDAVVLDLTSDAALSLLADLRARTRSGHIALIAVARGNDPMVGARALDLGADDVMTGPFDAAELALRVTAQLRRKHLSDRLRSTVRDGLRAALTDPMTGLYNRRYAIPHLSHTFRWSAQTGRGFAVMMADLDHFKRINDIHGHLAGDEVLIEAAKRLRNALDRSHVIARIGGEEFLIVMRDTDTAAAHEAADRLRRAVDERPFVVAPTGTSENVTISIGVAICQPGPDGVPADLVEEPDEPQITSIMHEADLALYESKHAGRNTVTVVRAAA